MTTAETGSKLPKSYTPSEHETRVRALWEQSDVFHATLEGDGEPFCILIPPPNVTAALHLGHAFNNTLQDILVRYHRMKGCRTLWMPGTDHAGIATQSVVEKRLAVQGKRRTDFTRDEFVARVQEWKDEYEATITEQLKAMGCSCDWQRQRFTMDDVCARAVREAFFQLFKAGLIYRGKRLVNWDPVTLTALADDEVEMKELRGSMWYLRYPLVHPPTNPDDPLDAQEVTWSELAARGYPVPRGREYEDEEPAWVTVATTRPETYLGDTAVAVNPRDPRATALDGLMVQLPIVGRVIPIVHDDYVVLPDPSSSETKAQYATGFLKVTPAHDANDWEIGIRHGERIAQNSARSVVVNVLAPDATISDQHGWKRSEWGEDGRLFVSLSREEARKKVVAEFKQRGLLEHVRDYSHSVGHSYRSHVPIEPYLSDQWYVKVSDDRLVGEAQRALVDDQFEGVKPKGDSREGDNSLRFYPERYAKMYQSWHSSLRDWCISRQLWWGHRIPVWTVAPVSGEQRLHQESNDESVSLLEALREQLQRWEFEGRISRQTRNLSQEPRTLGDETAQFEDVAVRRADDSDVIQALEDHGYTQDPDVLDTWFSSGLWPISTMGWPDPESYPDEIPEGGALLETFNPSSVLCTARDIVTLWVSRMVMFNRFFRGGKLPFKDVYIHPMIQDGHGQRMSKSLGNGVDPRDIIHTHGADALRFTLCHMATSTQDCRLPVTTVCPHCETAFQPVEIMSHAGYRVAASKQNCPSCKKFMSTLYGVLSGEGDESGGESSAVARNSSSKFDFGRNFCNKLWNATRFALLSLEQSAPTVGVESIRMGDLRLEDRWVVTRLHRTLHRVEDALKDYQFNAYAEAMYDFIWREFCDWYLEAIKPSVRQDARQQQVLRTVLNAIMRMLHPICPIITETLWPHVRASGAAGLEGVVLADAEVLTVASWPDIACSVDDPQAEELFGRVQSLVEAIRTIRGERKVPVKRLIKLAAPVEVMAVVDSADGVVHQLAGLSEAISAQHLPSDGIRLVFEGQEIALTDLVDAADLGAERQRLEREVTSHEKSIAALQARLNNDAYVSKAPPAMVQQTRDQLASAEAALSAARRALEALGG